MFENRSAKHTRRLSFWFAEINSHKLPAAQPLSPSPQLTGLLQRLFVREYPFAEGSAKVECLYYGVAIAGVPEIDQAVEVFVWHRMVATVQQLLLELARGVGSLKPSPCPTEETLSQRNHLPLSVAQVEENYLLIAGKFTGTSLTI